jgi:hypothetical protein
MNPEKIRQENERLQEKLKDLKTKVVTDLQKGKALGLDRQVRLIQQTYQLLRRI